jgi:hypothetical protein
MLQIPTFTNLSVDQLI